MARRRVRPRVTARSGEHRLPGGRATGSGTRMSRGASSSLGKGAMEMRSNHRVLRPCRIGEHWGQQHGAAGKKERNARNVDEIIDNRVVWIIATY